MVDFEKHEGERARAGPDNGIDDQTRRSRAARSCDRASKANVGHRPIGMGKVHSFNSGGAHTRRGLGLRELNKLPQIIVILTFGWCHRRNKYETCVQDRICKYNRKNRNTAAKLKTLKEPRRFQCLAHSV